MRELVGGGGEVSSVVVQLSQSAACLLCGVGGVRLSSTPPCKSHVEQPSLRFAIAKKTQLLVGAK